MKAFQLKVARAILNLGIRDIGSYVGVSGTTISKWENREIHADINTSEKYIRILEQFFMIKNIALPDNNSISLNESMEEAKNDDSQRLNRFQLRSGRAILGIDRKALASLAKTDQHVIARAENLDNEEYIRSKDFEVSARIKRIFSQHNIFFSTPLTLFIK